MPAADGRASLRTLERRTNLEKAEEKAFSTFSCRPHLPALSAVKSYKTLDTGHRQSVTRVIARRDARVRSQQHGRAVCGQRPVGERKSFFGDFLPISKKLPAGRRTAEALLVVPIQKAP